MPRRPRRTLPDGFFHVMAHVAEARELFPQDRDRRLYVSLLGEAATDSGWQVLTFVLMDTHVHLLVRSEVALLTSGMWFLQSTYTDAYKSAYRPPRGPLFDGRFVSKPVGDEPYLLACIRYIALNPREAHMCRRAQDYAWSADASLRGARRAPEWLDVDGARTFFDDDAGRYARFVDAADEPEAHLRVTRAARRTIRDRPPLAAILRAPSPANFVDAYMRWGYTLDEIATASGKARSTVHDRIRRAMA